MMKGVTSGRLLVVVAGTGSPRRVSAAARCRALRDAGEGEGKASTGERGTLYLFYPFVNRAGWG